MARALLVVDLIGQNAARREFLGPQWVKRDAEQADRFEREIVGDLHLQLGRHPHDTALHAIVNELRAASDRFATLWAEPPTSGSASSRKTFRHPVAGEITVDCDTLEVVGTDLRVVHWTATPDSPYASVLQLIGVVDCSNSRANPTTNKTVTVLERPTTNADGMGRPSKARLD